MRLVLVAEQDENRDVAWVWVRRPGLRTAKPIEGDSDIPNPFGQVEISIASHEHVLEWSHNKISNHCVAGRVQ
mgnify:CR=1 FL=1